MEKISRILPPSARTASYDGSRAQPVRPGAPRLGRPEPMQSAMDRVTLSDHLTQSMTDLGSSDLLEEKPLQNSKLAASSYKSSDNVKSQVVRDMTDKFFKKGTAARELVKSSDQTQSEEMLSKSQDAAESKVIPESSSELSL